jgi:hypothetical protein
LQARGEWLETHPHKPRLGPSSVTKWLLADWPISQRHGVTETSAHFGHQIERAASKVIDLIRKLFIHGVSNQTPWRARFQAHEEAQR